MSETVTRVPAIDGWFTTDQRGITRPQRLGCDIGAVELVFTAPTPEPAPAALVTPRFTG